MKKSIITLGLALGLLFSIHGLAQTTAPEQKMPVRERLEKARAAKAEKRTMKQMPARSSSSQSMVKVERVTPDDYRLPVDKARKGPAGEAVRTGERGGKFYINKNGNKTYLSSNQ